MLEASGPWITAMKGIGDWEEWTFNGGVKTAPLYFIFSPALGWELIPPVALNDDGRVGCLVFIFIISPDSRHGMPFAFAWGEMYTAAKMIEANSQGEQNGLQRKATFSGWESRVLIQQARLSTACFTPFYIKTYISSRLFFVSQSA